MRKELEQFIKENRKTCWESDYENGEYCLGENKVIAFVEVIQEQAEVIFTSEQVLKLLEKQRANCYEAFVNIKPLRRDTRFETYRKQIEAIKNAPLANLSE